MALAQFLVLLSGVWNLIHDAIKPLVFWSFVCIKRILKTFSIRIKMVDITRLTWRKELSINLFDPLHLGACNPLSKVGSPSIKLSRSGFPLCEAG